MPKSMKSMSPARAAYEKVKREVSRVERDLRIVDDMDAAAKERLTYKLVNLNRKLEEMTEPCTGEVHSTGGDGCGSCLGITWGRMLKHE